MGASASFDGDDIETLVLLQVLLGKDGENPTDDERLGCILALGMKALGTERAADVMERLAPIAEMIDNAPGYQAEG